MSFNTPHVCFAAPRVTRNRARRKTAKGYWIARVDVRDLENGKTHLQTEPLRKYGGKFLIHTGTSHGPEGSQRNIVVEFPSYQAAYDCWHSPEHQAAIHNTPFSERDVIIIEAYNGPQP